MPFGIVTVAGLKAKPLICTETGAGVVAGVAVDVVVSIGVAVPVAVGITGVAVGCEMVWVRGP